MNDIETRLKIIENRNQKVELEKAWETSWSRKISIAILTYLTIVLFFYGRPIARAFY